MKRKRIVVYPKDIQQITGRGLRYAQRILRTIRKKFGKNPKQFVTIDEYCEFSGLTPQDIDDCLDP